MNWIGRGSSWGIPEEVAAWNAYFFEVWIGHPVSVGFLCRHLHYKWAMRWVIVGCSVLTTLVVKVHLNLIISLHCSSGMRTRYSHVSTSSPTCISPLLLCWEIQIMGGNTLDPYENLNSSNTSSHRLHIKKLLLLNYFRIQLQNKRQSRSKSDFIAKGTKM